MNHAEFKEAELMYDQLKAVRNGRRMAPRPLIELMDRIEAEMPNEEGVKDTIDILTFDDCKTIDCDNMQYVVEARINGVHFKGEARVILSEKSVHLDCELSEELDNAGIDIYALRDALENRL